MEALERQTSGAAAVIECNVRSIPGMAQWLSERQLGFLLLLFIPILQGRKLRPKEVDQCSSQNPGLCSAHLVARAVQSLEGCELSPPGIRFGKVRVQIQIDPSQVLPRPSAFLSAHIPHITPALLPPASPGTFSLQSFPSLLQLVKSYSIPWAFSYSQQPWDTAQPLATHKQFSGPSYAVLSVCPCLPL